MSASINNMRISRAEFVRLAAASTVGFVGGCNVSAGNGERRAAPRFDDNFMIVFSDAHVCGAPNRAARRNCDDGDIRDNSCGDSFDGG